MITAGIEDGEIVIRIGVLDLKEITETCPSFETWLEEDEKFATVSVYDVDQWMYEVVSALNYDAEDGSTLISTMLNTAIENACDEGGAGVSIERVHEC